MKLADGDDRSKGPVELKLCPTKNKTNIKDALKQNATGTLLSWRTKRQ